MKVRRIDDHNVTGWSGELNTHGLGEMIVGFDDDSGMDSEYIRDYEVLLKDGEWVNLSEAFKRHDVVVDNYNRWFREALTDEEREKGWYD